MNSRHHRFILSSLLIIALLASCSQSPASAPPASTGSPAIAGCSNAYFPTSIGTSWSYSSSGSQQGGYTYTWTVTDLNDQGFTTSDQYSTGVNATIKWTCQNGNLSALNGGSDSLSLTSSKATLKSNSIASEGYNIPANFGSGNSWAEKVTVDGTITTSTSKTANVQIVTQLHCAIAGTETISVPAGKFDTVKAACTQTLSLSALVQGTAVPAGSPAKEGITNWYAKGIGLIQSVRSGTTNGTETIVLTQYSVK